MGMIIDGKYIWGEPDLSKLHARQNSTWQQHDQQRQRQDYARELIQPYDRTGKPNEKFIEAWPEESKEYGFIPKEEDLNG